MSDNYSRRVREGQELLPQDPARARKAFAAALAIRHAHAPLWKLYAEAAERAGNMLAAYDALRRAAFLDPGDASLLARLGKLAIQLGRREEGSEWSRKALAAAKLDFGKKLRGLFGAPGVSPLGRRSGEARLPKAARRLASEADKAASVRQFERALAWLDLALDEAPDEPELLLRKARAQLSLGKADEAVEELRSARKIGSADPEVDMTLIKALARLNLHAEASERLEALPDDSRRSVEGRKTEAEYLMTAGDAKTASVLLKRVAEEDPSDEEAKQRMARALVVRGEFDEALECLREAAVAAQRNGAVYYVAATIGGMPPGSELFGKAEAVADDPTASQRDRAAVHFALAHAHRQAGNEQDAFTYFERGNALVDEAYDAAQWDDFAERTIRVADRNIYSGERHRRGEGRIFIVSAPRSGSTLVERILMAHPLVTSVGESGGISDRVRELRAGGDYPECLPGLGEAQLEDLVAAYLADAPAGRGNEPWVADKNPGNFLHLGLIARMLPAARVIYVRRDPMDVGFSLFCQVFNDGHGYAYTQENIGHFLRVHDRLMAHWKETLPLPIHEVSYEALVADQEAETRRLLDALNLPFDDGCLAFHEAGGDVTTASVVQVRQKIYGRSVGAWKRFADRLSPLAEALEI